MVEYQGLMHMSDAQVVDFDMCRFGHPDKGPMRTLTNSLQVAQNTNRRYPSRTQHPTREHSAGWVAAFCKAIHAGTEDQIREDPDKTIEYFVMTDEFNDETTDAKFDEKIGRSPSGINRGHEHVPEKYRAHIQSKQPDDDPRASNWSTSVRPTDVTGAGW